MHRTFFFPQFKCQPLIIDVMRRTLSKQLDELNSPQLVCDICNAWLSLHQGHCSCCKRADTASIWMHQSDNAALVKWESARIKIEDDVTRTQALLKSLQLFGDICVKRHLLMPEAIKPADLPASVRSSPWLKARPMLPLKQCERDEVERIRRRFADQHACALPFTAETYVQDRGGVAVKLGDVSLRVAGVVTPFLTIACNYAQLCVRMTPDEHDEYRLWRRAADSKLSLSTHCEESSDHGTSSVYRT